MATRNGQGVGPYENGDAPTRRPAGEDSDAEEETMAADYRAQVQQYDDDAEEDYGGGYGGSQQDIQAQLQMAVTPLEYNAPLEAKFASYDNYVSLFHYILNSEGPVDLDLPSVCRCRQRAARTQHN